MTWIVEFLDQSVIASIMRSALYPYVRAAHFLGAALLVGGIILVDLRILGLGKSTPRPALHAFAIQWIWAGFILAFAAGTLLFLAQPAALIENGALKAKLLLLGIAGLNALAFECLIDPSATTVPRIGKMSATLSIILWATILLFSSLIPYWGF